MQTIIQHSNDLEIAKHIANYYDFDMIRYDNHIRFYSNQKINLNNLRQKYKIDFNYLPNHFDFQKTALFISDMDSTLINIECIDEIASFIGLKSQVSKITAKAMLGEIDFDSALIERVKLLKGLDYGVLEKVYKQKLRLNIGARELIKFFKNKNIKTAVVSGGFTYFTDMIAKNIGLNYSKANFLKVKDKILTGEIEGKIINAKAKQDFLLELCNKNNISTKRVIAIGDGNNDLLMLNEAGLSVAYHAKPKVIDSADIIINFGGLDKIMDFFTE